MLLYICSVWIAFLVFVGACYYTAESWGYSYPESQTANKRFAFTWSATFCWVWPIGIVSFIFATILTEGKFGWKWPPSSTKENM
jgi:hypothetical protein